MNQNETLLETNKYSWKLCYYTRLTSLIQTWKQPVLITDLKQDPVISSGHRGQINSVVSEATGCKVILDLFLVTKENRTEESIIKIILGCVIKFSEGISKSMYDHDLGL